MASFNLTVEDSSPLVTYAPAGAWQDSPSDDPLLQSYSGQNFHHTNVQGATASINFHGTGITVLGARRAGYGPFTVTVDGQTIASGAASTSADSTRQVLATVSGLTLGDHRLVLTNTGASGAQLDIDSVTIADEMGPPGSQIVLQNFDDSSPAFTYLPSAAAWGVNERDIFQGGSLRFSEDPNAAVTMNFQGEAIAVYGTMSPDHTNMKVTIDGEEAILAGGSGGHVSRLHTKTLIYFRTGLGDGPHTFRLASEGPTPQAPFIDLDAVAVLSASSPNDPAPPGSSNNNNVNPNTTPVFPGVITPSGTPIVTNDGANSGNATGGLGSGGGLPKGTIIGIAVGAGIGLFALLGLCYLAFLMRKRRLTKQNNGVGFSTAPTGATRNSPRKFGIGLVRSKSPVSPDLPMQQDPKKVEAGMISGPLENSVFVFPPPKAASPPSSPPKSWRSRADDNRHSIAPSYYGSPMSGNSYNLPRPGTADSEVPLIPTWARSGASSATNSPQGPRPMMQLPIPPLQVKVQPPTPITPPGQSASTSGYMSAGLNSAGMPSALGSRSMGYSRIQSPQASPEMSYRSPISPETSPRIPSPRSSPRMNPRMSPDIVEEERVVISPAGSPMSSPRARRNPSRDLTTRIIPPRKPVPAYSPDEGYGYGSTSSTIAERLNRSPRGVQRLDSYI